MAAHARRRMWPSVLAWIVLTLITLLPIYWMFLVSGKSRVELFSIPSFFIDSFYAQNYINLLTNDRFWRYLVNSVIVATGNAVLVTVLAFCATYALSRCRLPGKDNIFFWTITNRMAPPAAFLLPLFLIYTQYARAGDWTLFDTRIGLILIYCVFNLPFAIWLLKGIIDAIPVELEEAARIDGAGTFGIMLKVIAPLARPGLAVTMILTWVFAWNEYLFAATLTSVEARTITTGLAEYVTVTGTNWGEMAAASMLTMAPALIFLALAQRHIVAGLTFGALKE